MSESNEVAIKVDNLSKTFKLPHEKTTSVKSALISFHKRRTYEEQKALQDVSFEVKKGEFFGIVGRNGSGKSTLLKILAGIYTPTKGSVSVHGSLTPFIELGVGFNPELTGKENVFLNGALLGFNRKKMTAMYDEIVGFAELERFMDQKLKNYSSGMQVRLAFSIAIRAKSDILLIDEVLAVGDTAFQRKCYEVFRQMRSVGRTIVFVTHDMQAVERFCDRAMVINNGKISIISKPSEVTSIYDRLNAQYEEQSTTDRPKAHRWGTGVVKVNKIKVSSNKTEPSEPVFEMGKDLVIDIELNNNKKKNVIVGLVFEDEFGVNIAGPNSTKHTLESPSLVSYTVSKLPLLPGEYKLTVVIFDQNLVEEYDHLEKAYTFRVISGEHDLHGKINLFGKWEHKNDRR